MYLYTVVGLYKLHGLVTLATAVVESRKVVEGRFLFLGYGCFHRRVGIAMTFKQEREDGDERVGSFTTLVNRSALSALPV